MSPEPAVVPAAVDQSSAEGTRPEQSTWPRWEPKATVSLVALIVVLLALGGWLSLRGEWTPILDIAALEIRTWAIPDHLPLLGVFSRFGWYHPGPLFILQGWLPYELWGVAGLTAAIVAIHLVSLVAAWWVARRIDRLAGGFVLVACCAVLLMREPSQALEPWNPFAGLVSTVTLLVAAWASAQRMILGPIILLPLGTYLLQSHLGYVPLVGLTVLAAFGLAAIPARDRNRTVPWGAWAIGAGVAAALWLPVIVQQVTGNPGNITAIASSLGEGGEPLGPAAGLAAVSSAFAARPYWTEGLVVQLPEGASWPIWLTLTVAAAAWASARRDWVALRLLAICVAAIAAAFVAVTTATGVPVEYLVSWIPAVAATTVAMSTWAIARNLPLTNSAPRQAGISVTMAAIAAVMAAVTSWHWAGASQMYPGRGEASAVLGEALLADAGQTPFKLGATTGASIDSAMDVRSVYYGVLAAAVRGGANVSVPQNIAWEVDGVLPTDTGPQESYIVRNFDPTRSDDARIVARWVPLSSQELNELLAIDAALAATSDQAQTKALTIRRAELLQGRVALELVVPAGGMVGPS